MSVQVAPDWYSINLINLLVLGEFIEVSEALDNSFSDGKRMKNDVAMSIKEIENKISELKTKKEHVENRLRLREFFNYMMVFSALFFFAYINLQIFILNQRIPYINIISNSLLYIVRSLFRYIKLLPLIAVVPYIIVIIRKSMIRKTDLEIQYFEKLIDFKKGILKEDALEEYRGKLNEMKNISLRPRRLEDLDEEEFEFITQLMPNQIASDIKKRIRRRAGTRFKVRLGS